MSDYIDPVEEKLFHFRALDYPPPDVLPPLQRYPGYASEVINTAEVYSANGALFKVKKVVPKDNGDTVVHFVDESDEQQQTQYWNLVIKPDQTAELVDYVYGNLAPYIRVVISNFF